MAYIKGEEKNQLTLIPLCLDDYIDESSICHLISAFVESLDIKELGLKYAQTKNTGRPPYNPSNMLMLYIYGYINRIRSSRRLETETTRNIEVMWLMEKLMPDDKTICNFRKDNASVLKKVFREFSLWCNRHGLYGKEVLGVDGTKIWANSSRKNIHIQKNEEKRLASIEKKISEYMTALEENDRKDGSKEKMSPEAIQNALKRLHEKKEKTLVLLERIAENDGNEISTVDPDAHLMNQGGDGREYDACYNVITAVDEKHKLIADFEVSTCLDEKGILPTLTESAKEIMGVTEISAIADKGFYNGEDIEECENNGTTCFIPEVSKGKQAPEPEYNRENFKYDSERDCYICPTGSELNYRKSKKRKLRSGESEDERKVDRVYSNFAACQNCLHREQCTTNKMGRDIYRNQHQDTLDINNARMLTKEGRAMFRKRKQIVEHPFGTTKHGWGYRNFLCRRIEKVTGEQSLVFLAYNLRRVFNILKENILKENGTKLQNSMA